MPCGDVHQSVTDALIFILVRLFNSV